ncbi:MAG TPA: hypothetical protein VHA75_01140 [Rugosimonospora sp.]|nr:hypothetical protein [Rugosimonospora sp.]
MPVDPEPAPNGSLLLLDERDNGRPIVRVLGKLERAGKPVLYVSHFQTCRDAASFRGSRRPA